MEADRMNRRRLLPLLVSAAAVPFAPRMAFAQALTPIKLATTPTDIGAQPFYAADEGFFKAAGLAADTQIIPSGAAITAAVVGGAVDIAQSNVVSLASAHERGIDVVIVAPAGVYFSKDPTSALVVKAASPYKSAKDLNGKTIATNGLKNIAQIGPMAWLDKNGGDANSIKWTEMPFPEMPEALDTGRIDAALIAEPELGQALANKSNRLLANAYDAIAPEFLIGAWFTTGAWAKAHPAEVKAFQKAMAASAMWANKNRAASGAILNKYTKIVVEPAMKRTTYGVKLEPALMQPLIDAAAKFGAIATAFPAADLIAAEAK
jgi:NitT/TauT family transport system substrate-binding protein